MRRAIPTVILVLALIGAAPAGEPPPAEGERNGRVTHAPRARLRTVVQVSDLPRLESRPRVGQEVPNYEPPAGAVDLAVVDAAAADPGDRLLRATAAEAGTLAAVPALDIGFEALGDEGNPPDPTGAAGPDHVVVLINFSIAMYDRAGTLVQGPFSLKDFFGISNDFFDFDPIATYDPWSDRFIVSTLARWDLMNDSRIYVAFSQTNDPTGAWNVYWIDADRDQTDNHWADYHTVGIDRNAVYYTANMIPRTIGAVNVTLFVYDKEDGYAGLPLDNSHVIDIRDAGGGVPIRMRPAYVTEVVPGDEYYLAQADTSFGDRLNIFRLTGDRFATPAVSAEEILLGTTYTGPGSARQPPGGGSGVTTLGGRLFNAFYRSGEVWTAQAIDAGDGSIRSWVHRVDVSQNPGVLDQTVEIGSATADVFVPHVVPDVEDDDFALLTAYSGPAQVPTARYWNVAADGTIRYDANIHPGDSPTFSSRWGDYFAIQPDPVDGNRIWMFGMFAPQFSVGRTCVGSALFEDVPPGPPPTPDGDTVAGTPVQVAEAGGGDLTVTWGTSGCDPGDNHLVWFDLGRIDMYAIVDQSCDIGLSGTWTGPPPAGAVGVIVVPDDDAGVEGSHGRDSSGMERPSRLMACGLTEKQAGGACP